MTKQKDKNIIYVSYRIRLYIFIFILVFSVIPLSITIILYEQDMITHKNNVLILIPIFLLLSSKTITGVLEHLVFKQNLIKVLRFTQNIKEGNYDTHFFLPKEQDEENYFIAVLRNLESMQRVIKGQNNTLKCCLDETICKANMMKQLSEQDFLTGLFNRRFFDASLKKAFMQSFNTKTPFTLILIDCDKFKSVNDTFGHDAGDRVLCLLSDNLTSVIRRDKDIPCRIGGDEFAVVMPHTDQSAASAVIKRLRMK